MGCEIRYFVTTNDNVNIVAMLLLIAVLLQPFCPSISKQIIAQLNYSEEMADIYLFDNLVTRLCVLCSFTHLFPKKHHILSQLEDSQIVALQSQFNGKQTK